MVANLANIFTTLLVVGAIAVAKSDLALASRTTDHLADDLNLNAATAALKFDKTSHDSGSPSTIVPMMLVTLIVGGLLAVTTTITKDRSDRAAAFSNKMCAQVRGATAQCLFYALSALSQSPNAFSLKGKDEQAKRRTFSLDLKLDPCHLPVDDRRRCSLGSIDNSNASKMMTASLEAPLIDIYATTPKLGCRGATSRRCRGSSTAGRRGHTSCSPSPRFNGLQCSTSPYQLPQRQTDCGLTHTGSANVGGNGQAAEFPSDGQVAEYPGARTHPGRKPNLQRVKDAQEAVEAVTRQAEYAREGEDEWDDSDWEDERAEIPDSGIEMDGLDVGCVPSKVLELPLPVVPYLFSTATYGRSMFTSNFAIPRLTEA